MACVASAKETLDCVIAVTPVLISALVAWIARQQWRTNREKLRLDLYERRFAVYESTLAFYQALIGGGEPIPSESFSAVQKSFVKSYRESQFLFKPDSGIFALLGEVHSRSFSIIGLKEEGKGLSTHPETFRKVTAEASETLSFLHRAIEKLEHEIAPYLNFHKVLA